MPNTITAFLERLTAAAGDFNKAKVGRLGYMGAVFLDLRPDVARQGQTMRIYFPDVSAYEDQANNDWNPENLNPGYVDVTWGQRPGKAILVRDFEQFQSATDILDQFIDPNYKRACEYANGQVAALLNTTNFNAYPPLQASKAATIPRGVVGNARRILLGNKVPVQNDGLSSLIYHPDVDANILSDANWDQESLVSAAIAANAFTNAAENGPGDVVYGFKRRVDQQAPTGATANLTGTAAVTNGSTAVVGTTTKFTTEATVGTVITVGDDDVGYVVDSVTDDTHLTLAQPYGGTTASGKTFVRATYTSVALHKYAIALAVRPLELVNNSAVVSRLIVLNGIPMRLMLSYQHLKAGWLMTLDYAMVAKVIRPDYGILINS